jgi:hypothetical protein
VAKATLMDVFGAATQAASPFVEENTARLKEQNDLELRNTAAMFATELDNRIRDLQYTGDFDAYQGKLQGFTDEFYGKAAQSNTSPYFQKNIQAMRGASREAVRNIALRKEDDWRFSKEKIDLLADLRAFADSSRDTATILDESKNRIQVSKGLMPISPEAEDALWQDIVGNNFNKALVFNDDGKVTTFEAMDALDKRLKEWDAQAQAIMGEDVDRYLPNRKRDVEAARQATAVAIWKRNYNGGAAKAANYLRLAHDARETGDAALIRQAIIEWQTGSELRERALHSETEYDPSQKDSIAGWFPVSAVADWLYSGEKGAGGGKSLTEADTDGYAVDAIKAILNHETLNGQNVNIQDLHEVLVGRLEAVAAIKGNDPFTPDSQEAIIKTHNKFWTLLDNVIMNGPEFQPLRASYQNIKNFRTQTKQVLQAYPDNSEGAALIDGRMGVEALNLLAGWDFVNGRQEDLDAKIAGMKSRFVSLIRDMGKKELRHTGLGLFGTAPEVPDAKLMDFLRFRNEHPEIVMTEPGNPRIESQFPGYAQFLDDVNREEEKLISSYTKIATQDLEGVYEPEAKSQYGNNPYDVSGRRLYRQKGTDKVFQLVPGSGKDYAVWEGTFKKEADGSASYDFEEAKGSAPLSLNDRIKEAQQGIREAKERQAEEQHQDLLKFGPGVRAYIRQSVEKGQSPHGESVNIDEPPPRDSSQPDDRRRWENLSRKEKVARWADYYERLLKVSAK